MLNEMLNGLKQYKWKLTNGNEFGFAKFPNSKGATSWHQMSDDVLAIVTDSSDIEDFVDDSDWVADCSEGVCIDNFLVYTPDGKAVIFKEYAATCWTSVYEIIVGNNRKIEDYWYQVFVPDEDLV